MKHPRCPQCGRERDLTASDATFVETDLTCPECLAFESGATLKLGTPGLHQAPITLVENEVRPPSNSAEVNLAKELEGRRFGGYHIERLLGRGGMAWVFLATHLGLRRPCAIKVLCPSQQTSDARSLDEFMDEARAAASIVHPHVVTVHNVGTVDHQPFVELEFVHGEPLSKRALSRTLSIADSLHMVSQAVAGLAAAHQQGFVHRDFKPGNVLVSHHGLTKLSDFGLAKRVDAEQTRLAGTPAYMAPELFQGVTPTPRCDVYAAGISLIECLTGAPLFRGSKWTDIAKLHQDTTWDELSSKLDHVPVEVLELLRQCVAKDAQERYATGTELLAAIHECQRLLRPLDRLIQQAITGLPIDYREEGGQGIVTVHLEGGRQQRVLVDVAPCEESNISLVRIFSVGGPIDAAYFRRALEINSRLSHGAVAIQEVNGEPHFVVMNSYPRATCDAAELRHSIQQVAERADELEFMLTGKDEF